MPARWSRGLSSTTVVLWLGVTQCVAQTASQGLRQFQDSVEAYTTLVQHLEHEWPPVQISQDTQQIRDAIDARSDGIRRARANATMGELFNPAVAALFRSRIREASASPGCGVRTM